MEKEQVGEVRKQALGEGTLTGEPDCVFCKDCVSPDTWSLDWFMWLSWLEESAETFRPGVDLTIRHLKQILHPEEVGGGSVARTEHIMSHGRFLWTSIQNIEKWYTSKQYQQQVEVHFQVFIQSKVANIRKIYLMTRLMVSTVFM